MRNVRTIFELLHFIFNILKINIFLIVLPELNRSVSCLVLNQHPFASVVLHRHLQELQIVAVAQVADAVVAVAVALHYWPELQYAAVADVVVAAEQPFDVVVVVRLAADVVAAVERPVAELSAVVQLAVADAVVAEHLVAVVVAGCYYWQELQNAVVAASFAVVAAVVAFRYYWKEQVYVAVVVSADPAVFVAVVDFALHYWQALHSAADLRRSFQKDVLHLSDW